MVSKVEDDLPLFIPLSRRLHHKAAAAGLNISLNCSSRLDDIDVTSVERNSRRSSSSSLVTSSSPITPTSSSASSEDSEDSWNLIPYNIPWGPDYYAYAAGTLPGPEGKCMFLRSPTPLKNQRTSQACRQCRERKAKCTGTRPACDRCSLRGQACQYTDDTKRNKRAGSERNWKHQTPSVNESHDDAITAAKLSVNPGSGSPVSDDGQGSWSYPSMSVLRTSLLPSSDAYCPSMDEFLPNAVVVGINSCPPEFPEMPQNPPSIPSLFESDSHSVHAPQPLRHSHSIPLLSVGSVGDHFNEVSCQTDFGSSLGPQLTPPSVQVQEYPDPDQFLIGSVKRDPRPIYHPLYLSQPVWPYEARIPEEYVYNCVDSMSQRGFGGNPDQAYLSFCGEPSFSSDNAQSGSFPYPYCVAMDDQVDAYGYP